MPPATTPASSAGVLTMTGAKPRLRLVPLPQYARHGCPGDSDTLCRHGGHPRPPLHEAGLTAAAGSRTQAIIAGRPDNPLHASSSRASRTTFRSASQRAPHRARRHGRLLCIGGTAAAPGSRGQAGRDRRPWQPRQPWRRHHRHLRRAQVRHPVGDAAAQGCAAMPRLHLPARRLRFLPPLFPPLQGGAGDGGAAYRGPWDRRGVRRPQRAQRG